MGNHLNLPAKCPICEAKKINFLFEKNTFEIFQCSACGLAFIWPQPEIAANNDMYQQWGEDYYLSEGKISFDAGSSFEERLDQLGPFRKTNKLLDVGCSTGAFLSSAKARGWDTYGVELSYPAAQYAREVKKLEVFCGTLAAARYDEDSFDVVNIWAVLEHVMNPSDVLREIHRVLRRGGLVVFCVPNFNSLPIRILGKHYRYITEGHLFYFTQKSIRGILNLCGFVPLQISSDYFSPLTFFEDCRGVKPDTLKTHMAERKEVEKMRGMKYCVAPLRLFWKIFMFFVRKLYWGEELRVLAVKK